MVDRIQTRIATLYCVGDHWRQKGMYEVAEIYYTKARKLEESI